jgi:predicted alpha/beta superfamily hydrolase
MGGVISMHATLKYNNVFSRAASLSGSFFVALESMLNSIETSDLSNIKKLYIDAGTKEIGLGKEQDYIASNKAIFNALSKKLTKDKLSFQLIDDGIHHESHWAKRLPYIIQYLFSHIC